MKGVIGMKKRPWLTEEVIQNMTIANLANARKRTLQFLKSKPVCSECGEKFHHFSKTMLCTSCRLRRNKNNFLSRNPGYLARQYQKNKRREIMRQRRHHLLHKDQINLHRRIKRAEKRRNYEDSLHFRPGKLERDVRKAIDNCVAV